jgi:hypothetical protein
MNNKQFSASAIFNADPSNPNDREITVTKTHDGLWIRVDGYTTMSSGDRSDAIDQSIIFVDTLYEAGVTVHIWSHPDVEDATHRIELKREDQL